MANRWKIFVGLTGGILFAVILIFGRQYIGQDGGIEDKLTAPADERPDEPAEDSPPKDRLVLSPAKAADLAGWWDDDHREAFKAYLQSCRRWKYIGGAPGPVMVAGHRVTLDAPCAAAIKLDQSEAVDQPAARSFFEQNFSIFRAGNAAAPAEGDSEQGLFTGYYEPELQGSLVKTPVFQHPLYRRPDDLVTVDLGRFRDEWKGQRLAGRVIDGRLHPYADRAAIEQGKLAGRGLELVWVDSPVDAFFLHVQGSGRVRLQDGSFLRVGFDGHNGHPYKSIGGILIRRGEIARADVSLQSIRQWLAENPQSGRALMWENPAFIFFAPLDGEGPLGAQSVALTAGRSLAIDRRHIPLGLPLWLDSTMPSPDPEGGEKKLRRLMIAQDTGSAIVGPVRGDIFWGAGAEAEYIAGHMKQPGRYFLMLPKQDDDQNG